MEEYQEEVKLFNHIYNNFNNLNENDTNGAYKLMIMALQCYNRWSKIRCDYRKGKGRGEGAETKDRLEEMCKYLKEIHITCRMVWKNGLDDYRGNKED